MAVTRADEARIRKSKKQKVFWAELAALENSQREENRVVQNLTSSWRLGKSSEKSRGEQLPTVGLQGGRGGEGGKGGGGGAGRGASQTISASEQPVWKMQGLCRSCAGNPQTSSHSQRGWLPAGEPLQWTCCRRLAALMWFEGSGTCDVRCAWYISCGSSPPSLAFKGSRRHKELLIVWCRSHALDFHFTGSQWSRADVLL